MMMTILQVHRGHGHAIAKGCDLNGMMAEIMGKRDGLGHGKGGSMHVAEIDKGMLGANGIVSGGFGLAIGASISIINQGKDNVAVCFFGWCCKMKVISMKVLILLQF